MQHVSKKWLHLFNGIIAIGLVGYLITYFFSEQLAFSPAWKARWGFDSLVLIVGLAHLSFILFIYPFISKKILWLSNIISMVMGGMFFSIIIDNSGHTNLLYRLGFAVFVFFMGMTGPFAPLTAVCLTWVVLILTINGGLGEAASVRYNIIIDSIVTLAALAGWLVFKSHYQNNKSAQEIQLATLLEQEKLKSGFVLESISDGVMVLNTQGQIQLINAAAANLLGWTKEDALMLDYHLVVPMREATKELPVPEQDIVKQIISSAKPVQKTYNIDTKHKKTLYLDIAASPIMDRSTPQASVVAVVLVLRDVSDRKEQERQRSEFISTASHEMRTPVAAIEGFLALALNPAVSQIDSKAHDYLLKAHSATQHLGQLFQDLLTISKAEDGRLENHPQLVEMGKLFSELVEEWHFAAKKKNLTMKFMIGDQEIIGKDNKVILPLYYTMIDPERIREVFTNLFDNAVKYTVKGGITIRLQGDEKNIQVSIEDTGAGIASEDIPHLFQKFYRADSSSTRQEGGTGLGLYICRRITDLYNGHITVDSELGKGSRFTVSLPRASRDQVPVTQPATAIAGSPNPTPTPTTNTPVTIAQLSKQTTVKT